MFEEAAYWTASRDLAGERLSGERVYRLHFPAGQLPPNDAFWSLKYGAGRGSQSAGSNE
ncbi:DUF1214 domain-containing protein [Paenarthrobacter sp. RAF9]